MSRSLRHFISAHQGGYLACVCACACDSLLIHNSRTVKLTHLKATAQWFLAHSQSCAAITTV